MRVASLAGVRHRLAGTPGDDAYAWTCTNRALVLAVADGVGSVPGSGPAARRAVDAACSAAAASLERRAVTGVVPAGSEMDGAGTGDHPGGTVTPDTDAVGRSDEDLASACGEAVAAARAAVAGGSGATTLVVAAVGDDGRCRLVRVGDSSALLLSGPDWEELFAGPEADRSTTATAALPAGEPAVESAGATLAVGDALVLVTDGIGDPIRDGPETVAPGLAAAMAVPPSPLALAWVADFSRQGCHDDRTVLALWRMPVTGD